MYIKRWATHWVALVSIGVVVGSVLAVGFHYSPVFTVGKSTPSMSQVVDSPTPLPGKRPSDLWRLLEVSTADQNIQFNVETVLATETGIHVFYSVIGGEGLRGKELVPDSVHVKDDLGNAMPVASVTSLGSLDGASVGVISLAPYQPGSRLLTLNVSDLRTPADQGKKVAVRGNWRLSFVERLDTSRPQHGKDVLKPATEGRMADVQVEADDIHSVVQGTGFSTHRLAITNAKTGETSYVHAKITSDGQVVAISAVEYEQIFQEAYRGAVMSQNPS